MTDATELTDQVDEEIEADRTYWMDLEEYEDEDYEYDWEMDRACSYPCHICGEEDDWDDDLEEDE